MKELVCCVSHTQGTNILIFLLGCFSRNSSRLNTTSAFTSTTATGGRNGFFRWVKNSENNSSTNSPDSRITETQTGSLHLAAGMCNMFDLPHTNMIGWQINWHKLTDSTQSEEYSCSMMGKMFAEDTWCHWGWKELKITIHFLLICRWPGM